MKNGKNSCAIAVIILCAAFFIPVTAGAEEALKLSQGQTVYVPAYSHIYSGHREQQIMLTITVSIRNVSQHDPITITTIDYHETHGDLIKKYLKNAVRLPPLGTVRYVVSNRDKIGGSGANFIVVWEADKAVNPPIIETVMISTPGQGVSFTSRGQAISQSGQ